MMLLTAVLALAAVALLAPGVSDLLSLAVVALRPGPRGGPAAVARRAPQRLLILVPAHNEELLIEACVRSLLALRYPSTYHTIIVIADNCTDRTAVRARELGARCLERGDPARPGKPRAIAWALERLPVRDYDAVVIVDADTVVDPEFAAQLNASGPLRGSAAQAFFDLSNPDETPITRMAAVLATATHQFAYPLKRHAGLNVPLVGNGMVLGTDVLWRFGWHAFSICEDWEMYALLTAHGVPIAGVPRARLKAQEARSLHQSSTQRQRWTAGKLIVLKTVAPRLLRSEHIGTRQKLDAIAELMAPGPALHFGVVLLLGAVCVVAGPPAAGALLISLGASLLRPGAYTALALAVDPRPGRALRAFAFLPVYAVWRIGAAVRALGALGNAPWVRTERHEIRDA